MESLQDFRKDHRNFQRFAWIVTIGCLLLAGFIYWDSQRRIEIARATSYVAVNGLSYPMVSKTGFNYAERIHEYEMMAELYYIWRNTADQSSLKSTPTNFDRSINLVEPGESSDNEILRYEKDQIVKNVMEEGWTYEVKKDSLLWDIWEENGAVKPKPWKGFIFGKQTIHMGRRVIVRNLHVGFEIYDAPSGVRNHENPFAALIKNTDIFNNQVLSTK